MQSILANHIVSGGTPSSRLVNIWCPMYGGYNARLTGQPTVSVGGHQVLLLETLLWWYDHRPPHPLQQRCLAGGRRKIGLQALLESLQGSQTVHGEQLENMVRTECERRCTS